MTDKVIYRNLTEKDIVLLIEFSIEFNIENDIWGFGDEDDLEFTASIERITEAYNELMEERKLKE